MTPDLVHPHIGRVQILLRRIEDHPMNRRLLVQGCILNILIQAPGWVYVEDIQETSVVVEGVAVDAIRRLFRC